MAMEFSLDQNLNHIMKQKPIEMKRRGFLKNAGAYASTISILPFSKTYASTMLDKEQKLTESQFAQDFSWENIRREFELPDYIHLESGYYSPQPRKIFKAHLENVKHVNLNTAKYMREDFQDNLKETIKAYASFLDCDPKNLVINRNTTECLATVINGLSFENGEEVLLHNHDYPTAIQNYLHRKKWDKINLKMFTFPAEANDDEIVDLYEEQIKSMNNPTYLHLTPMVNFTGQVLPYQRLIALGRKYGMEIIFDAAHAVAHIELKVSDVDVDYFMTSMHKWSYCPFGGALYINPEKKSKLKPFFGETSYKGGDIRNFYRIGTIQPLDAEAVKLAIELNEQIGIKRKQERLSFLTKYWVDQLKDLDRVTINTPMDDGRSCAIANFKIDGMEPPEIVKYLFDNHKVFTASTHDLPVKGVRVTPNVFTLPNELDVLVEGITQLVKA